MADLADELLRDLEGDEEGDGGWHEEEEVDAGSPGRDEIVMPTTAKKLGKRKAEDQDAAAGLDDDEDMNGEDSDDGDDVQVKEEEVEMQIPEGGVRPAQELDADDVAQMQLKNIKDVSSVARLAGSKTFKEVLQVSGQRLSECSTRLIELVDLQKVEEYASQPATDMSSPEAPEYKLIVQANNVAVEIDNEVLIVQKVGSSHAGCPVKELMLCPSSCAITMLAVSQNLKP